MQYSYEQLQKYPKSPLRLGDLIETIYMCPSFYPDLVKFHGIYRLVDFRVPTTDEYYLYQDQFTPEHFISALAPFYKDFVKPARIMQKPSEFNYKILKAINIQYLYDNSYFIAVEVKDEN